jgi:hypothetical protein
LLFPVDLQGAQIFLGTIGLPLQVDHFGQHITTIHHKLEVRGLICWLRHCAAILKVVGSIPVDVTGIFIDLILPAAL